MRLWTIDPSQLDAKGLVALWREGLLAQAVLAGRTNGYKHHPQLDRFRHQPDLLGAYLSFVWSEAKRRGYHFDSAKIDKFNDDYRPITVTSGQVDYEMRLLQFKLDRRLPSLTVARSLNPVFIEIPGIIERWEKIKHIGA